jgi:murein DD-endopeptidase MepM/ murein hydrolase activator NlpD
VFRRVVVVGACLAVVSPIAASPAHAEPSSKEIRKQLDETAERVHHAEEQEAALADDLDRLRREIDAVRRQRTAVQTQLSTYARGAYMTSGSGDAVLVLMTGNDADSALQKVEVLDRASRHARSVVLQATTLDRKLRVASTALATRTRRIASVRKDLAADGKKLEQLFTVISAKEAATAERIAKEAARKRRVRLAAERARITARRASRSERSPDPDDDSDTEDARNGQGDASTSGGYACAVGPAHSFRDTWGDRRSGGRRHKGADIFAPHGSPIYAVTTGRIVATKSGGLGGRAIILHGDNGDSYYYAHNSSHAVSAGERVQAGEYIGAVGATGNAAGGAAHVHFELWPGGSGPVNPYRFLRRICG